MKRVWIVSFFACQLAGCVPGEVEAPLFTVTDSGGVELVTSTALRWSLDSEWRLSTEPDLLLGSVDAEGPELFHRITAVELTSDGRMWVANAGDGTIRVFESDGSHVFTTGGSGDGPGEFVDLVGLEEITGGVLAYQRLSWPVALFDLEGRLTKSLTVTVQDGLSAPAWAGTVEGSAVVVQHFPQGRRAHVGLFEDSVPIYLSELGGEELTRLGTFPGSRFVGVAEQNATTWQEFTPSLQVAGCGESVFVGWPDTYELKQFASDGQLVRIMRRVWTPSAVGEAEKDAYRLRMTRFPEGAPLPVSVMARQTALADAMEFPDHHPAYRRLLCDQEGYLWVERDDPSVPRARAFPPVAMEQTQWDVFSPEGAWLGSLALPERFWAMAIDAERIAGVLLTDMDVQYLAVYTLDRRDK